MPKRLSYRHRRRPRLNLNLANTVVILASALLCTLALMVRVPGLNVAGIGPNWALLWVVTWSVHHGWFAGLVGGLCLGLLQDSLTAAHPTHALGLALVGFVASRLQRQELGGVELISVALLSFFLASFVEVLMACQLTFTGTIPWLDIWRRVPLITLSSSVLTSLWTPVVYWPLTQWWDRWYAPSVHRPWR